MTLPGLMSRWMMPSRCARVERLARAPIAVRQRLGERQRPAREPRAERLAVEILHHQELDAVLLADVVERADVRMVEPRDGARLALEPLPAVGLCGRSRGGSTLIATVRPRRVSRAR